MYANISGKLPVFQLNQDSKGLFIVYLYLIFIKCPKCLQFSISGSAQEWVTEVMDFFGRPFIDCRQLWACASLRLFVILSRKCISMSYTAKSGSISNSSSDVFFFVDLNFVMALLTLSEILTTLSISLVSVFNSNAVWKWLELSKIRCDTLLPPVSTERFQQTGQKVLTDCKGLCWIAMTY